MRDFCAFAIALALLFASTARSAAPSDPAGFGTVFNIGTGPFDPPFDVPGAVTGTVAGNGTPGLLSPTLTGDTLGSNSQLNLFPGGATSMSFRIGPPQGGNNAELNIFGGTLGGGSAANTGSTVNLSSGFIGDFFTVLPGSTLNVTGGTVGDFLGTSFGTTVNISGGTVRLGFVASGSVSDFRPPSSARSGVSASVVNVTGGGNVLGLTAKNGSIVNISGGSVGALDVEAGGIVNVSAGLHRDRNRCLAGGTLNISGGTLGIVFCFDGSTVNASGGSTFLSVAPGSSVSVSGGVHGVLLSTGATVSISGGDILGIDPVLPGNRVDFFGTSFFVDGVELTGAVPGQAFVVADRGVTLTGGLEDGSALDLELDAEFFNQVVTVTLVDCRADFSGDGVTDLGDLLSYVGELDDGEAAADTDGSGAVDFRDAILFLRSFDSCSG